MFLKLFWCVIVFIAVLLVQDGLPAAAKTASGAVDSCRVTVFIDHTFPYKLLKEPQLSRGRSHYEGRYYRDSIHERSAYVFAVPAKISYTLQVSTVWGVYSTNTFRPGSDTSVFIQNHFDLLHTRSPDKKIFTNADTIRLFYNTSGCFHDNNEQMLLLKKAGGGYTLRYAYDTVMERRIAGRLRMVTTMIEKQRDVPAAIAGQVFEMVSRSELQADSVEKYGDKCGSTTSQTIFVLINNRLFRFNDYGVCDWNLYNAFRKKYFRRSDDE